MTFVERMAVVAGTIAIPILIGTTVVEAVAAGFFKKAIIGLMIAFGSVFLIAYLMKKMQEMEKEDLRRFKVNKKLREESTDIFDNKKIEDKEVQKFEQAILDTEVENNKTKVRL